MNQITKYMRNCYTQFTAISFCHGTGVRKAMTATLCVNPEGRSGCFAKINRAVAAARAHNQGICRPLG
jgi:hypothetical protein